VGRGEVCCTGRVVGLVETQVGRGRRVRHHVAVSTYEQNRLSANVHQHDVLHTPNSVIVTPQSTVEYTSVASVFQ